MPSTHRRSRLHRAKPPHLHRAKLALVLALTALTLAGCANTLQDKPVPHNTLEALLLAPYPVYWLGGSFHGLPITSAGGDPGGAFTIQYGDCLEGGQTTCVPPLKVVTSPDNSFVPGQTSPTRRTALVRGVPATVTEGGATITIPTGRVVLSVFAATPLLARAAAQTAVPVNYPSSPDSLLAPPSPSTSFTARPLPSQMPSPLRPLRR